MTSTKTFQDQEQKILGFSQILDLFRTLRTSDLLLLTSFLNFLITSTTNFCLVFNRMKSYQLAVSISFFQHETHFGILEKEWSYILDKIRKHCYQNTKTKQRDFFLEIFRISL